MLGIKTRALSYQAGALYPGLFGGESHREIQANPRLSSASQYQDYRYVPPRPALTRSYLTVLDMALKANSMLGMHFCQQLTHFKSALRDEPQKLPL